MKQLYQLDLPGQTELMQVFQYATRNNKIVCVLDKHGSGMSFALKKFNYTFPDIKFATISLANDLDHDVAINMFHEIGSILKISNKNYKRISLGEFLFHLNNRAKLDLRGRKVILIFDRFEKLKTEASLNRCLRFIYEIKFKGGIIIRTNKSHIEFIRNNFPEIYASLIQFERKTITPIRPNDVVEFCKSFGLKDKNLCEQIANSSADLRVVIQYLRNHSRLLDNNQLTLF